MDKQTGLSALQKELFVAIKKRITKIIGPDSEDLIGYEHAFTRSFPERYERSTISQIKKNILAGRIVLCSDFHSMPFSQEKFLDIMAFLKLDSNENISIALECFAYQDQEIIDSYLDNQIDEQELYEKTKYQNFWGFPWKPVQKIMIFAKEHHIPVVGINKKSNQSLTLHERDVVFAKQMKSLLNGFPDHKMLCLIGEHHLSPGHLPSQLKEHITELKQEKDILCLLSCTKSIYFNVLKNYKKDFPACLNIGNNFYCILDHPPWAKWLSFLMWQEHVINHPDCDLCLHPWEDHHDESCFYDLEDYILECLNILRSYNSELLDKRNENYIPYAKINVAENNKIWPLKDPEYLRTLLFVGLTSVFTPIRYTQNIFFSKDKNKEFVREKNKNKNLTSRIESFYQANGLESFLEFSLKNDEYTQLAIQDYILDLSSDHANLESAFVDFKMSK